MDNKILFKTGSSRKKYTIIYILTALFVLFFLNSMAVAETISIYSVISAFLLILVVLNVTEIHRIKHRYELTPYSVVHIDGYLSLKTRKIDYFAISDIVVRQSFLQRILNYGNVEVSMFNAQTIDIIKDISHPHNFSTLIEVIMRKSKNISSENNSPKSYRNINDDAIVQEKEMILSAENEI